MNPLFSSIVALSIGQAIGVIVDAIVDALRKK